LSVRSSLPATIDRSLDVVSRIAAPWLGLLLLGTLPLRLAQAELAGEIIELGERASAYGDHLLGRAVLVQLALPLAVLARALYVRAFALALGSQRNPGREALRVRPPAVLGALWVTLVADSLGLLTVWSFVSLPLSALLAGLGQAVAPRLEQPGMGALSREVRAALQRPAPLLGLCALTGVALLLASFNLAVLYAALLGLAGAVPGLDVAAWSHLLGPDNARFVLWVLAGALLAVEPFWLGALVVHVHDRSARASGDDLRAWLERLRQPEAA
jgi:hypothetical protein